MGSADLSESVPCLRKDLVGARQREDLLQIRCLQLLDAALNFLIRLEYPSIGLKYQKMQTFVQDNMSRVLSLHLLFSENRTIAAYDDCSPGTVTSNFLTCYKYAFPELNAADSVSHDRLALCLQQMVQVMLTIAKKEALGGLEHKLGYSANMRFSPILSTMVKYGKNVQTMATCIVPVIVQCMRSSREVSHEITSGFDILKTICNITAGEHDVAVIQQLIVTNLTAKYYNKDTFDVLLASQTTYNTGDRPHDDCYANHSLFDCINTIFRNPVHHNAFYITLLLQTRLFDILVLSLINCTQYYTPLATLRTVYDPGVTLRVLLELLERKPYQRGCGFIFFTVETQYLDAASGTPVQTEEFCTELPGVDCTSTTLSTGMLEQMCRRLVNTDKRQILSYKYKICNIATALIDVMSCTDNKDRTLLRGHMQLCFKILSLLTETHDEIIPEIGLEWSASWTAPHDMHDDANLEANFSLAKAVEQNPMLRNALVNGRLHFNAADWQAISAKQGLFVPVNSLVYQRGLSSRGTVQIGSVYFRPVARGSMQGLLGCRTVLIVMDLMPGVTWVSPTYSGDRQF